MKSFKTIKEEVDGAKMAQEIGYWRAIAKEAIRYAEILGNPNSKDYEVEATIRMVQRMKKEILKK